MYKTVGTFCNKYSVPRFPKSMLSRIVHRERIRAMCIPTLLGGGGRGGRMTRTWILNHTCHFAHIQLYYDFLMVSRACVPTNFVQDCSFKQTCLRLLHPACFFFVLFCFFVFLLFLFCLFVFVLFCFCFVLFVSFRFFVFVFVFFLIFVYNCVQTRWNPVNT